VKKTRQKNYNPFDEDRERQWPITYGSSAPAH